MIKDKDIQSAKWLRNPEQTLKALTGDDRENRINTLAQIQMAAGNFAGIVLGKNVLDVRYVGNDSYTNGKSITIAAPKTYQDIDVTIGLVAHEASHIKYTDFSLFDDVRDTLKESNFHRTIAYRGIDPFMELTEGELIEIKDIINIVEDARIDMLTMKDFPGLTPYYAARYDKHRNTKDQTEGYLTKQNEGRDKYLWAICNWSNPNRNASCLDRLQDVVDVIDYKTLVTKSFSDVIDKSCAIWEIIRDLPSYVPGNLKANPHNMHGPQDNNSNDSSDGNQDDNSSPDVTPSEQREIDEVVDQLLDEAANANGAKELQEFNDYEGDFIWNEFTKSNYYKDGEPSISRNQAIFTGVSLGRRLSKDLQFRNMDFGLTIPATKSGKLSPSKLAMVPSGYETPFYRVEHTPYQNYRFVFSIDASGSMSGMRMDNAMKMLVALATALNDTPEIEVEAHLRGGGYKGEVTTFYNSKKDSIFTLYDNCKQVTTCGSTPDGECFKGMNQYLRRSFDGSKENVFISLSDGGPNNVESTVKSINKIKEAGYPVIGFFIGDEAPASGFHDIYGDDAATMPAENLTELSRYFINKVVTPD